MFSFAKADWCSIIDKHILFTFVEFCSDMILTLLILV